MSEADARAVLEGLDLAVSAQESEVDASDRDGVVVSQQPAAGEEVPPGTEVVIAVGRFTWSEPIVLEGNGNDVILDFQIPGDAVAYVRADANGDSNFVVDTYDEDGEQLDLLFNGIAPYEAGGAINLFVGENTREFDVMADGPWTMTFEPIQNAPNMQDGAIEGESDEVVFIPEGEGEGRIANVTHQGESNFVIDAYGDYGSELLVNEIGDTDVRARWPSGTQLLEIMAEGTWTIELSND
ncbi:PASTA domain-containing protein [Nitriliruptoria bacterium AS10]|nr:PASTA domain-containing protein [Salsipaludibacter albus]